MISILIVLMAPYVMRLGGDFFTLMRKFRRLPEDWVKLYVMEVLIT